jgi:UDP-3-O-[3-hydroxymyristoyl] glucosamine N-acyltransferase
MSKKVKEIAEILKGELTGNGEILIKGVNGIKEAVEGDLAFILDPAQVAMVESTAASCVVIPKKINIPFSRPTIRVDDPSTAFSKVIAILMPDRIPHPVGIHPTAIVPKNVKISKSAALGAYVILEEGVSIGDGTLVYPLSYVGKNAKIGNDCIIYPNVTIREEITIGNRVIIHPGTVVGSDGFGYDVQKDGTYYKIPQMGTVIIEDDVELGSCVTIDRARFAKTVIGKGSKIDNLCQIAHNVIMGPNCVIAAQSGVSGSTELGRNVVFGGQVGVADHLKIGDFVIAGAKSGISKSFPAKTTLFGYPARPVDKARDLIASTGLLPKLFERVRALESKIKELEKK